MDAAAARRLAPALIALAAIYMTATALAMSGVAAAHPPIAVGVAFDLTVTAASAFWWLAVRPGHARAVALIRVVAVGLVAARLLVGLTALGVAGALVEAAVLAVLATRITRLVRHFRVARRDGASLPAAFDAAFTAVAPARIASFLATEVAAVTLAVTGWFRRPAAGGYSMHRSTGVVELLGVLMALTVVETVGLHLVLDAAGHPLAALIATIASTYGGIWLLGALHAIRLSPLRITGDHVVIERGLGSRVRIPLASIAHAEPITTATTDAVALAYGDPNLLLTLSAPATVHGLFGRRRDATRIALSVDDRDAFLAALTR